MTQSLKIDSDDADQEILAMSEVKKALSALSTDTQKRVLDWAYSRFLSTHPSPSHANTVQEQASNFAPLEATTNVIAIKLGGNDCLSLMKAAACHLVLVKGKIRFERQDLLNEMKDSDYYKESYGGNMSYYIKNLLKSGFFNEPQRNTYAIVPHHLKQLEKALA